MPEPVTVGLALVVDIVPVITADVFALPFITTCIFAFFWLEFNAPALNGYCSLDAPVARVNVPSAAIVTSNAFINFQSATTVPELFLILLQNGFVKGKTPLLKPESVNCVWLLVCTKSPCALLVPSV